jgi:2-amino-4-hydroxy-6-hydroxymethyldihydropteridine diphosphokinase
MDKGKLAVLSLGSNIGDRVTLLQNGLSFISRLRNTEIIKISPLYETAPWGVHYAGQAPFINLCVLIRTEKTPKQLLWALQRIEYLSGRQRKERFAPRTLDIDIIGYEGVRSENKRLILPHPRAAEISFVLVPLFDIFPDCDKIEALFGIHMNPKAIASGEIKRFN